MKLVPLLVLAILTSGSAPAIAVALFAMTALAPFGGMTGTA